VTRLVALVLVAACLAGCGSGGDSSTGSPGPKRVATLPTSGTVTYTDGRVYTVAPLGSVLRLDDIAVKVQKVDWKPEVDLGSVDGVSIKHDVSVPVSRVPDMIERASAQLAERFPDVRILAFGHVGDGNVHYNCSKAERQEAAAFFAQSHEVNRIVYDVVNGLNGSISAEHGLGVLKRDEIKRYKSELELDLMRTVKRALDPQGIMNPGKVL